MESILPFSVLNSKRKKYVRITQETEASNNTKVRQADYQKTLNDFLEKNLYVKSDHINFISNNIDIFYRNNLTVLFLALNILHNPEFINTDEYRKYIDSIQVTKVEGTNRHFKADLFEKRLNVQIQAYTIKIKNVMTQRGISYI